MKRTIAALIAVIMLLTGFSAFLVFSKEQTPITITVNGQAIDMEDPVLMSPYTDRVLIPLRSFCDAIGADISWVDESQEINIIKDTLCLNLQINRFIMYQSLIYQSSLGTPITLDTAPGLLQNRTYMAVRPIMEALGFEVEWDESENTVHLTEPVKTYPIPTEPPVASQKPTKDLADPFTEELYQEIKKSAIGKNSNFMVSPMSLKIALAMLANGTEGETKEQILKVTGIKDLDQYNESMKELIKEYAEDELTDLSIANSLWLNQDYLKRKFDITKKVDFADTYKDQIQEFYDGTSSMVTDKNAVSTINGWIEDHTNDKIKDVINDNDFLFALVNALYMKADWMIPFQKETTRDDIFTTASGEKKEIPFMRNTSKFQYLKTDDFQAIQLPYKSSRSLSMYVVLPEEDCDPTLFLGHQKEMELKKVALSIPKFKIESEYTLNDALLAMGMEKPFVFSADFKPMAPDCPLPLGVSLILQKTFIEVDEKGTEAAAATAISAGAGSAMPQPEEIIPFHANRPFAYFICDDVTGEVLFIGEFASPNE